jgi:hypothetical protein
MWQKAVPLFDADRASLVRDLLVQQAQLVLVHVGLVAITQEDPHLMLGHEVIDPRDRELEVVEFHAKDVTGELKHNRIVREPTKNGPFIGRRFKVKHVIVRLLRIPRVQSHVKGYCVGKDLVGVN